MSKIKAYTNGYVTVTDNSDDIKNALVQQLHLALDAVGITAQAYATLLCPVDTGNLRNSISYTVQGDDVYIGSNVKYAPYVELGTGKFYNNGVGGRQTPWVYYDEIKQRFVMTSGQKAQPFLKPAASEHTEEYNKLIKLYMTGK